MTITVIGCGNEGAGDDMAGLVLVNRLAKAAPAGCVFRTISNPIDLLEAIPHEGTALIVDGVVGGAAPGAIHLMRLDAPGDGPVTTVSGHTLDIEAVVRLAQALGRPLPRLMLLGIEIGSVEPGTLMTDAVRESVAYCEAHFEELRARAECGAELTVDLQRPVTR